MARPVAAIGEVHYNGFDFPGPVQCQLRVQSIYDGAGRIVKYRRYTLTVECVLVAEDFSAAAWGSLSPGDPIDAAMKLLRYKLTQSGAQLKYKNQGMGTDIDVSRLLDIEFGPKPQSLQLNPVGSAQAWHLVWTVQFTPKECGAGIPASWGSMTPGEWWYSVTFSIAPNGLSTRTVTGSIEAFVTRNAAGSGITFTADLLRERIQIPRLPGFNRQESFDLSPDKRFLSFSYVDTQIPGTLPYPEGIVSMRIKQRVSADPMEGYKLAQSRLSGSIEVVQGVARWYAWLAFLRVVQSRLGAVPKTGGRDFISVDRLEIDDEITGSEVAFSMGYTICTTKEHLLADTGLWQPIAGTDWAKWRTSMERLVGVRADAGLRHNISDDVVLNFCSGLQPRPVAAPFAHRQPGAVVTPFACEPPSKEASWREYTVDLIAAEKSGTVLNRPAAPWPNEFKSQLELWRAASGTSGKVATSGGSMGDALTIQERSPPLIVVGLRCVAERVGYPINPDDLPHLDSMGGEEPVYINQEVEGGKCGGNACGQPVYRMYCTRWYYVTKSSNDYTLTVPDGPKRFLSQDGG